MRKKCVSKKSSLTEMKETGPCKTSMMASINAGGRGYGIFLKTKKTVEL